MQQLTRTTLLGLALSLTALNTQAADPIKVGSVLSVTGPAAFLGDPDLITLHLYVDELIK